MVPTRCARARAERRVDAGDRWSTTLPLSAGARLDVRRQAKLDLSTVASTKERQALKLARSSVDAIEVNRITAWTEDIADIDLWAEAGRVAPLGSDFEAELSTAKTDFVARGVWQSGFAAAAPLRIAARHGFHFDLDRKCFRRPFWHRSTPIAAATIAAATAVFAVSMIGGHVAGSVANAVAVGGAAAALLQLRK